MVAVTLWTVKHCRIAVGINFADMLYAFKIITLAPLHVRCVEQSQCMIWSNGDRVGENISQLVLYGLSMFQAESKGATATEYGFVFGIFELVSFICSPLIGKYVNVIGPKFLLKSGLFVAGICSMLFGFLHFVEGHAEFIGLSFAIRIVESVGASAATTAAFSITAAVFPDCVATTFATLEVFYGLGYIVGPMIGGLLFSLGGFALPFLVVGCVLLLDGLIICLVLPSLDSDRKTTRKEPNLMSILRVPSVALVSYCTTAAAMSAGFLSATLEPHLRQVSAWGTPSHHLGSLSPQCITSLYHPRVLKVPTITSSNVLFLLQFELSPVTTGLMFVLSGTMYAISAPLIGRLCDSNVHPKKLIALGGLAIITCYFLVGPFPFIPVETSHDFPDDISTYGLVSGLWASFFALGAFVGPSMAGFLFDLVGFRQATLFVIVVHVIEVVAVTMFVCLERSSGPVVSPIRLTESEEERERESLVNSNSRSRDPIPIIAPHRRSITVGYGSLPIIEPYHRSRISSITVL
uniref:Major facilitator superfamily (MFS) profile domain-containing protein n=1 Tax=Timema bartmani TaxID=61472 RepID=A0A7R9EZD5_9NEOP|nr:unnamed protein product [Timema bartmani]